MVQAMKAAGARMSRNIPHLLHVFPSFSYGGVPIRIAGIINNLGRRYQHTILALDGNLSSGSRIDPTLGVRLEDPGIVKRNLFGTIVAIRRSLMLEKPDLLLTYNWGAIEWALTNTLLGVAPNIHFESGFGPEEIDHQIPRRVWMRRIALRRAHALVVPSFTLKAIASDVWRIPAGSIRHIPNGVDCDLFGGSGNVDAVPGLTLRQGECLVGTVAPLRREKNIPRLIRAFAQLRSVVPARLLIAGDGPERPALEALVRKLDISQRVIFAGHVEQPELVYPLLDIFAITSDTEQMPNTVIQAMAAGRPVAGLDVGDIKAILSDDNAALVAPKGDEAALVSLVDKMLDDADLRRALGSANRDHVRKTYSLERMMTSYDALFATATASLGDHVGVGTPAQ